ncbi:MAG: DUF2269 family protein [bacterium]
MIAANVQFYDVVVWVHISAAILAFGPTFGYAFFQAIAERTDPRAVPTVMRTMSTIDRVMVTPGILVLIAAGIYLTADRWEFSDAFVGAGIVLALILLGFVHGFFGPAERKLAELAERDIAAAGDGEVKLSDEYMVISKRTGRMGTLAGLIVILAVYLMTAKPFL